MKLFRRVLQGAGCILLAAILIAIVVDLVAPRATHAVVAVLVQVANTPANPVPVTEVGTLQSFTASCQNDSPGFEENSCSVGFPAGKRLVIQTVGIQNVVDPGANALFAEIKFSDSIGGDRFPMTLTGGNGYFQQTQQLVAYSDVGFVKCVIIDSRTTINSMSCTISGYLINKP